MNERIKKFDKIFNCQKCDRTLWLRYWKLPDGRMVCPTCYNEYSDGIKQELKQKLAREEKEKELILKQRTTRKKQKTAKDRTEQRKRKKYIDDYTIKIEEKGLSELIFNFFEKRYKENPTDIEIKKLWKLLQIKHHLKIEYPLFFDIITNVDKNYREIEDLADFEKDITPLKNITIKSNPNKNSSIKKIK